MKWTRLGRALVGIVAATVLGGGSGDADAGMGPVRGGPAPRQASGAVRHPGTGFVSLLSAPAGEALPGAPDRGIAASADLAARAWLGANGPLFGLDARGAGIESVREEARPGGGALVRFRQTHRGVPVFGGQLNVAVDGARRVTRVSGETIRADGLGVIPTLDAAAARAAAVAATAAKYSLAEAALATGTPELMVYDPVVFDPGVHAPGLVWQVEVTSPARPLRELVLVDAAGGGVRLAFNQIDTARDRMTYDMNWSDDEALLPGTLLCSESETCTGVPDAFAAHAFAGDTYDYLSAVLGRDGIDDAGMTLVSSVHFGSWNAFWTGTQMVYGDGFSQADDVVGHELAHGVTDYTSNLYYWAESGAINESYSDLHGEFVDLRNAGGTDTAGTRWLLGEDIPGLGAIRDMADPPAFGDPDRMGSPNYYRNLFDNAGVHTNSGVNNKAVYLLTDGDSFNGQSVTGIGADKVAWLYYVVQRDYLTPASNYVDLADFLRAACADLAATTDHGFSAGDCTQVESALLAVEMDLHPRQRFTDDASDGVVYAGTWDSRQSDPFYLYGTHSVSETVGNTVTIPFKGTRATIYYGATAAGGVLDVYLDDLATKIGSINQSSAVHPFAWALELTGLPRGEHLLILRHASGPQVVFDAVAFRRRAGRLTAFRRRGFRQNWYYYPANVVGIAYQGLWNVWPGDVALSSKRGNSATVKFVGDAFKVFFWADPTDPTLGSLKILIDGKRVGTFNQRAFSYGEHFVARKGLRQGKHTLELVHARGQTVNLLGLGLYDLP